MTLLINSPNWAKQTANSVITLEGKFFKRDIQKIMSALRKAWCKLSRQEHSSGSSGSYGQNLVKILVGKRRDKIWSFFILVCLKWFTTPRVRHLENV